MKSPRPTYLNLFQFAWPVAAIASITHRVTGVIMFVAALGLLYVLDVALASPAGFAEARALLGNGLVQLLLWVALTTLGFHLIAGIKHMLLDFHYGDTPEAARFGATATFVLTAVWALVMGGLVW